MDKVTLIIPTRDRSDTLRYCLETACEVNDDNFEILVSDNCSRDDTRHVVMSVSDPRVRYIKTSERLAMSQHWEFALSQASGDWIGFIGDDDGILPEGISRVRQVIAETKAAAIRMAACQYIWPSLSESGEGQLVVPLGSGIKMMDSRKSLDDLLGARKSYPELPMIYHGGFARRDLIDAARSVSGRFFVSQQPDVYSSVVLAMKAGSYAQSDMPAAIHGASSHSTGQSFLDLGTKQGKSKSASLFMSEPNIPLHPKIGLIDYAAQVKVHQLLVVECMLQALDALEINEKPDIVRMIQGVLLAGKGAPWMSEWASKFAALNGNPNLDYSPGSITLRLRRTVSRTRRALNDTSWKSARDSNRDIPNVASAARVAEKVYSGRKNITLLRVMNAADRLKKAVVRETKPWARATPSQAQ